MNMSIFGLSKRTKDNLSACVGVPFGNIVDLSLEEEISIATRKYGSEIVFSKKHNSRRVGRGNPLLARKKIRTLKYIEKKIAKVR